ncbi:MAG: HflC protein [Gammaproteobacteria bacterium]|uniref:Protein HflC n=1 Tax=OM182 bacterium MED-G24 TaxID=1986255 RepID=A0A2A5X1G8_9GAMM|nr:HflC protein [Gammaproteobacteria bacterium]PDH42244.1 MAG: HflC protein [OM182 bacterium MED-G24]RPG23144.1 MAG: protease modulator HflC [Gammaproteobacteria bacterium TMED50]|tara:strand:+ start:8799 stop:9668 length:870 start_codon:yes stop_codon:yes gene_type:complete
MNFRTILVLIVVGALAVVGYNSVYVVTELQRAVLLQFGELVESNIQPGLHFKKPFINDVVRFDARVLTLDARPERFLTLEKKAVIVDSFAKFRVDDSAKFYTSTSGDETRAESLLKQRINTGLRNEISTRSLYEVVSGERDQLMNILTEALDKVAREELGVEIVDVRVKRIDLPNEVSDSVYDRMNTERDIEAKEHRAQGQELAAGIRADADKQQQVILAEAYAEAEEIRGEGDAQAAAIYASAYNKDPEFYKFNRSMQAYAATFSDKGDIILVQPDSDFFKYLKSSTQ